MSERLAFEKWEGLGNDFILIERPAKAVDSDWVRRLCDRRFGIGADGILVAIADEMRPRMIVYNADGSRPEMCGNGLRCVAAYLTAGRGTRELELRIATDAGERSCHVKAHDEGRFEVVVEMGRAHRGEDLSASFEGQPYRFFRMDVGNPHAVTFDSYDETIVDRLGPAIAVLPLGGTNVEFCRITPTAIDVTVWERGVGRTMACGTGACAVAAAACETGRASFDQPVRVALPGGELFITVSAETRAISMRGPARRVFRGEVPLA